MKTSFYKMSLTTGLFLVAIYIICLGWQYLLTDVAIKTLHMQLLSLTFPGFVWLSWGSFIWGAILSVVYGLIGVSIFRWLHKICCNA